MLGFSLKSIFLFFIFTFVSEALNPEVILQDGPLKGDIRKSRLGREFVAFKGIPYAKPPTGSLRFASSQPPEPWTTIRSNPESVPICIQRTIFDKEVKIIGQEDCLYLSVYTPKIGLNNKYPVMVYFHGGGLEVGSSELYGPNFLLDKDIVLVIPNYRLGPFGFLSTGDEACPGNEGLKDQVTVLKWVKNNIEHFGGDPDLVTIFGESAGGSSVETHMISPLSQGLFHRAIAQSGVTLNPWFMAPKSTLIKETEQFASQFGCQNQNSEELIRCLRKPDAVDIINGLSIFQEWDVDPMFTFRLVVENENSANALITKHPKDILSKPSLISSVPLMMGLTSEEGAVKVAAFLGQPHLLEDLFKNFANVLPISGYYKYTASDPLEITKRLKQFFFGEKPVGKDTLNELVNVFSDLWFFNDIDKSVRQQAARTNAPVYYYYFTYRGDKSFTEFYGSSTDLGVCHMDDLLYLFPFEFVIKDHIRSAEDNKMIDLMTTIWTEFAKTGLPPSSLEWPPVSVNPSSSEPLTFLNISSPEVTNVQSGLLQERVKFWSSLSESSIKLKDEL